MTRAAHQQIATIVTNPTWARWAAQLAPVIAIESIIAWLDVGQPNPDQLGHGIRQAIHGLITAAQRAATRRLAWTQLILNGSGTADPLRPTLSGRVTSDPGPDLLSGNEGLSALTSGHSRRQRSNS
jgi:hypothetical protein